MQTARVLVEAQPTSGQAPLVRPGEPEPTTPHDDRVPVHSFQHDFLRKLSIRRTMGDPDEEAADGNPMPVYDKADVNYRYADRPGESCGDCAFYRSPGSCEIVAGLIRPVDVCDKFKPKASEDAGARRARVAAPDDGDGDGFDLEAVPGGPGYAAEPWAEAKKGGGRWVTIGGNAVFVGGDPNDPRKGLGPGDPKFKGKGGADRAARFRRLAYGVQGPYGGGPTPAKPVGARQMGHPAGGVQYQAEAEPAGRWVTISGTPVFINAPATKTPTPAQAKRAAVKKSTRGMNDEAEGGAGLDRLPPRGMADEVAPPGFEPVVKALKRRPGVDEPYAVAWSMYGKGVRPEGDAEDEVAPPGLEPMVKALKKKPGVVNPYAVAWSRYKGDAEDDVLAPRARLLDG